MVGSTAGLGVHALAQKFQVLQLVTVEAARDTDALTTDDDHLLAWKRIATKLIDINLRTSTYLISIFCVQCQLEMQAIEALHLTQMMLCSSPSHSALCKLWQKLQWFLCGRVVDHGNLILILIFVYLLRLK